MSYTIREIKKTVNDINIETKLFTTDGYPTKPYGVRVRDLDAEENITTVFCPTMKLAEKYYNEAIR